MTTKKRITLLLAAGITLAVIAGVWLFLLPLNLLPQLQKPAQQPVYDYYEIVDEAGGESLMTIPIVVNVGDELLTEDNRRFRIVKVVENKAYARQTAGGEQPKAASPP